MAINETKYVLEERPRSEVFTTDSGFIGIRQIVRGEETTVLFTPEETSSVILYLQKCLVRLRGKSDSGSGRGRK